MPPSSPISERAAPLPRLLFGVVVVFIVAWFATLGVRKLLNPDEGRYAEIPREMLVSGDWVIPHLNDLEYLEKPPLQYWATAIAYQAFGLNEFTARLWCGLTGLAGIFFAGWVGARLFGRDSGFIAAAVLASSLMYAALGHVNTLDMGLSFFLQLAIGGFLLAQQAPENSRTERNYMLLAWGAAALAVLSKGIVAMALPAMTLVFYTLIEREYSAWRRLHIVPGLLLFLVIAAPWFIAATLANDEFAEFFFLHEHFQRFFTDAADRVEPWWYFIPILLASALPWTILAAVALPSGWAADRREPPSASTSTFRPRRFLIGWIAATMLFFSVSHSKLPPYILPVLPAIALLIGDYANRTTSASLRRHLLIVAIFWLLALCYAVFGPLPKRRDVPPEIFIEVFRWGTAGFAAALLGTLGAWWLARRERVRAAMVSASAGAFLAVSVLLFDFDVMRQLRSGYDLAQAIKPSLVPDKPLYSISAYDHSLSFYIGRPVTLVAYQGELIFGQQREPAKSLPDLQTFEKVWQSDPSGSTAVMTHDAYRLLTSNNLPMTVIGRSLQLTAVKKP